MAQLVVRIIPVTAVAIGGKHDFKSVGVRHVVAEMHSPSDVLTVCGRTIVALPSTWQPSTDCKRCPQWRDDLADEHGNPALVSALGAIDEPRETNGFLDLAAERRRMHALLTIRTCQSKRLSREIAAALGFESPEAFGEQYPELLSFVTYIRKGMANKWGKPRTPV